MPLSLRIAQLHDAGLLNRLGFTTYPFAHLWTSKTELTRFLESEYAVPVVEHSLRDSAVCWLIAETDRPIGIAKLTWHSEIAGEALAGTLLNKLYLSPEETGKGYGRTIFDEISLLARAHGQTFLWLQVLQQNTGARRFYESLGMKHVKDEIFSSATQQSIVHVMGKIL
ncbi:GNAT family N-acetyltransferase [Rouxiella silvae]|uniref:GNAT family N-acetyltransferase n=1 Tax=Rouxiella silvae TaxID=1646373 RepID=A0AA41BV95_9GAMM|nr:GNAT family N-acetyltransferase [Rouxiella silvae]MBF6635955.1 GNAT family N-acetyltransferase [Rouxiella silvae]